MQTVSFLNVEEKTEADDFEVNFTSEKFMGLTMYNLSIKPLKNIIRFVVSIKSDSDAPLYESNYEYQYDEIGQISFKIPDYPLDTIQLKFSSDASSSLVILIKAYIEGDNNENVILETYTIGTEFHKGEE